MKTRNELLAAGATIKVGYYLTDFLSEICTEFATIGKEIFYVTDSYNTPDEFFPFTRSHF